MSELFDKYREPPASSRKALGFHDATDSDLAALSRQKREILKLLRYHWVSAAQLIHRTGATSATRRVRELRQEGYEILMQGPPRGKRYHWTGRKLEGRDE